MVVGRWGQVEVEEDVLRGVPQVLGRSVASSGITSRRTKMMDKRPGAGLVLKIVS